MTRATTDIRLDQCWTHIHSWRASYVWVLQLIAESQLLPNLFSLLTTEKAKYLPFNTQCPTIHAFQRLICRISKHQSLPHINVFLKLLHNSWIKINYFQINQWNVKNSYHRRWPYRPDLSHTERQPRKMCILFEIFPHAAWRLGVSDVPRLLLCQRGR